MAWEARLDFCAAASFTAVDDDVLPAAFCFVEEPRDQVFLIGDAVLAHGTHSGYAGCAVRIAAGTAVNDAELVAYVHWPENF